MTIVGKERRAKRRATARTCPACQTPDTIKYFEVKGVGVVRRCVACDWEKVIGK